MDTPETSASLMEQVLYEVKKIVVGQDRFPRNACWWRCWRGGHLLVEGRAGAGQDAHRQHPGWGDRR